MPDDLAARQLHVVHVITTIGRGGAENQLLRVLRHLAGGPYRFTVIGLTRLGDAVLEPEFTALGADVEILEMRPGRPTPAALFRLHRILAARRPDVVQTWLYHADLIGSLAARRLRLPVIWTLQCGPTEDHQLGPTARFSRKLLRRKSGQWPSAIISSSQGTQQYHEQLGYAASLMTFIPNGADTTEFAPDPVRRQAMRQALGVAPETVLIGISARCNEQKDYRTFVRAAALVLQQRPHVRFVAYGENVTPDYPPLANWIEEAGLDLDAIQLLGLRSDVADLDRALDIGCLSSAYSETFPLAISEMMASGVPCSVTDVGDLACMVGETGTVAPPKDAEALAAALLELV
ncbi:MAG: glycosyltransferase, partial [Armatimonadetes bacterium]|nr:glycosyltransferase [Armatimonadota bacterium]